MLRALRPLADVAPIGCIQAAAGKVPNELMQMFSRSNPKFIRTMCQAVFHWRGLDARRIKPLRIHGKKDRVIPPPADADLALDGGHLIAMTHADECVRFVLANLSTHKSEPGQARL